MEKDYSAIISFLEQQDGNLQILAEQNANCAIKKIVVGFFIAAIMFIVASVVMINTYKYVSAFLTDKEILDKKTGMPINEYWHTAYVAAFIVSVLVLIISVVFLIKLPINLVEYVYMPKLRLFFDIFNSK